MRIDETTRVSFMLGRSATRGKAHAFDGPPCRSSNDDFSTLQYTPLSGAFEQFWHRSSWVGCFLLTQKRYQWAREHGRDLHAWTFRRFQSSESSSLVGGQPSVQRSSAYLARTRVESWVRMLRYARHGMRPRLASRLPGQDLANDAKSKQGL